MRGAADRFKVLLAIHSSLHDHSIDNGWLQPEATLSQQDRGVVCDYCMQQCNHRSISHITQDGLMITTIILKEENRYHYLTDYL